MARQAPRSMLDIDGDPDQNHRPWEAGAIEPLKSLYSCLLVHREKICSTRFSQTLWGWDQNKGYPSQVSFQLSEASLASSSGIYRCRRGNVSSQYDYHDHATVNLGVGLEEAS